MKLDCIFLSHSHYDHIGAVPYLRGIWPGVEVFITSYRDTMESNKKCQEANPQYIKCMQAAKTSRD
jgi:phosphoribosyl 1,2-cyclic phosphodiesterase